ncbi:MAG: PEP-CTERM sorting domain-containing protein, partial [Myxococcota bacterium]
RRSSDLFSSSFSDPLLPGLHPGSTLTNIDHELEGETVQFGIDTGFGIDGGPNKITLRPITVANLAGGLIFNIVIDSEDVVEATPEFIDVADSLGSALLFLNLAGGGFFTIGMMTNTKVIFSAANLTPGGFIEGSVETNLALWKPHPVPEPSGFVMLLSGIALLIAANRRRRRLRFRCRSASSSGVAS